MPNGLANGSGVLGHYLMDNFKSGFVGGWFRSLKGTEVFNDDGAGGGHLYIPRHTNLPGGRRLKGVLRGWQFQPATGSTRYPGFAKGVAGWGGSFKREVRDISPARVFLAGFGECLPTFDNYCEIDPNGLTDRYGIPQLRFHATWRENERQMAELMYDNAEEILRAAGAEISPYQRSLPPPPGDATHEVGTARMGDDPRQSVLNRFNQAHEVRNLFVVDGASFVSCPEKNCTLTIAAVSWRASEYLAEEFRRGAL